MLVVNKQLFKVRYQSPSYNTHFHSVGSSYCTKRIINLLKCFHSETNVEWMPLLRFLERYFNLITLPIIISQAIRGEIILIAGWHRHHRLHDAILLIRNIFFHRRRQIGDLYHYSLHNMIFLTTISKPDRELICRPVVACFSLSRIHNISIPRPVRLFLTYLRILLQTHFRISE